MYIDEKAITFVVHGLYEGIHPTLKSSITYKLITSIEKLFPNSSTIFSTWEDYEYLDILQRQHPRIKLVLTPDPGDLTPYHLNKKGFNLNKNNVNRHILSSIQGLKKVTTKYSCLLRPDFVFQNSNLSTIYQKLATNQVTPKKIPLKQQILAPFFGSIRSSYNSIYPSRIYPFHPSDIFHFGLTEDLIKMWDCDLMKPYDFHYYLNEERGKSKLSATYNSENIFKFLPEQYIFTSFLKRHGLIQEEDYIHMEDAPEKYLDTSDKIIRSLFIFASFREIGLSWQRHDAPTINLPNILFNDRALVIGPIGKHLSMYSPLIRYKNWYHSLASMIKYILIYVFELSIAIINLLIKYIIKKGIRIAKIIYNELKG